MHARRNIAALRDDRFDERERLTGELAGGLVIGDAEPCPLNSLVRRRLVEVGERQRPLDRMLQPPDPHRLFAGTGVGRSRRDAQDQKRQTCASPTGYRHSTAAQIKPRFPRKRV